MHEFFTYKGVELAKQEAAMSALMAGFSLTIALLLIDRDEGSEESELHANAVRSSALALFVSNFFVSLVAAFLFSVVASEPAESARSYSLLLLPTLLFAVSAMTLMLGVSSVVLIFQLKALAMLGTICVVLVGAMATIFFPNSIYAVLARYPEEQFMLEAGLTILPMLIFFGALAFRLLTWFVDWRYPRLRTRGKGKDKCTGEVSPIAFSYISCLCIVPACIQFQVSIFTRPEEYMQPCTLMSIAVLITLMACLSVFASPSPVWALP